MSSGPLGQDPQHVLNAERAINEEYSRAIRKWNEKSRHQLKHTTIVRSQLWTGSVPRAAIELSVSSLIGRVVLEADHPGSDLFDNTFYVAKWGITTKEFVTVNWAAPAARLFFEGRSAGFEGAASVDGRRTFVARQTDLVGFHDDVEPDVTDDPFARGERELEVPAPPLARIDTPSKPAEVSNPAGSDITTLGDTSLGPPKAPTGDRRDAPYGLRAESAVFQVMEMPKTGHMGAVLPTMQPDQYKFVAWPATSPLVVQGQPGTGKTVIAAHRAAYLTSDERGRNRIDRLAVIGPSALYVDHINPVLAEVAERSADIRPLSLPDLMQKIVGLPRLPHPERATRVETKWQLGNNLYRFVRKLPHKHADRRMVASVREAVYELRKAPVADVTNDDDERDWLASLPPWEDLSRQGRYLPVLATIALAIDPSAAAAVSVDHLIVDEAQDVRPIEWHLLSKLHRAPSGGLSLFGDMNQRRSDWTYPDWKTLATNLQLTDADGRIEVHELEYNYRSTRQILRFANQLLPRGTRGEQALRGGPEPRVVEADRETRLTTCADEAVALGRGHDGLVAIISIEPSAVTKEFRRRAWTRGRLQHSWSRDDRTVVILHPDQARGLEFDGVVVDEPANFPENFGRQGVLYTSLTRANKELVIVHSKKLPKELRVRSSEKA